MQILKSFGSFVIVATVVAAITATTAPPAAAQALSRDEGKCLSSVYKGVGRLQKTVRKVVAGCAKDSERGQLAPNTDLGDCVDSDSSDKIGKAKLKITGAFDRSCAASAPAFGLGTPVDATDGVLAMETGMAGDLFGSAYNGGSVEPGAPKCRSKVARSLGKFADAITKEYGGCIRTAVAGGAVAGDADLEGCFDSVDLDPRKKIGKSFAKLEVDMLARCPDGTLGDEFPGVCAANAGGVLSFGACVKSFVRCRACLAQNIAGNLSKDCDQFDNGVTDTSCPPSPVTTTTMGSTSTTTTSSTSTTTLPGCGVVSPPSCNGACPAALVCKDFGGVCGCDVPSSSTTTSTTISVSPPWATTTTL